MESSWDRFGRTKASLWRDYGASPVVSPDYVAYTYDYAGNRTERHPKAQTSGSHYQSFEYDGLHRLQKMTTPASLSADGLTQEWTLDQLGNWTTFKHDLDADGDYSDPGDLNQTRTHNDVNEIGTISGWFNPAHDAAGNMTTIPSPHASSGAFTVTYDAWNRVVRVENNTSTTQTNEYDGLNRRIVKIDKAASPDVTYNYYYNQQWQVVEIRKDGDTDPWKQYVYHPYYVDAIAMRIDSSGDEHYYLQDANFNVTAMVDDTGTVAERYDYTPYGEVNVLDQLYSPVSGNTSTIANEYLYTGRRLDPETGLQLNRNRFYASHLGRWVSRDPVGYRGGSFNLYEYVGGMPTHRVDSWGLYAVFPGDPGYPSDLPPVDFPPRTPEQCCEAAKNLGWNKGAAAGVICCNGKKIPCVWDVYDPAEEGLNPSPAAVKIQDFCSRLHERDHFDDVDCNPKECLERPPWRDDKDPDWEECKAHIKHVQCLKSKKKDCKGDAWCEAIIDEIIRNKEKARDEYCRKAGVPPFQ